MTTTRLGRFVVTGTDTQVNTIRAALGNCAYPITDKLPRDIPVTFADLSRYQARGLFWTDGRIQIEQTITGTEAEAIFLAEAWHAIDQYLLTNADRAALLTAAHDTTPDGHTWFDNETYYADLGETCMDVFLAAFTAYPPTGIDWDHPVNVAVVKELRRILGTPTEPQPAEFPWAEVDPWLNSPHVWRRATVAAKAIRTWKAAQ